MPHDEDDGRDRSTVDAIMNLADAIRVGLRKLGTAEATTPFGALEAHGMAVEKAGESIQSGLEAIAEAIEGLTKAIEKHDER